MHFVWEVEPLDERRPRFDSGGKRVMDYIQCEECGEKATVFDDGRPYTERGVR